jgi:hypothetical protein
MLKSLGLGGDGDEVDAIEDVEREFGVRLDVADAPNWCTVGDVYLSLQHTLPPELRNHASTWERFCKAISNQSCVDSNLIDEQTRLLAPTLVEELRALFVHKS